MAYLRHYFLHKAAVQCLAAVNVPCVTQKYVNTLLTKLDAYVKHENMMENLLIWFNHHKIVVAIGLEIEFYANTKIDINLMQDMLDTKFDHQCKIIQERGDMQYEIVLEHTTNIMTLINQAYKILGWLKSMGFKLSAKPHHADYGNALHINISFFSSCLHQYFAGNALKYLAGYICSASHKCLLIFINQVEDITRLTPGFMAPTHYCYGIHNRTALIRLTSQSKLPPLNVLEHRLANPNTNLVLAIWSILQLCYEAIAEQIPQHYKMLTNNLSLSGDEANYSDILRLMHLDMLTNMNDCNKYCGYEIFGNAHNTSQNLIEISKDLNTICTNFIDYISEC